MRQLIAFQNLSQKLFLPKLRVMISRFGTSPHLRTLLIRFGLLTVAGILLSLSGPFGTYRSGGVIQRFIYWFVLSSVSISIALSLQTLVWKYRSDWHPLLKGGSVIFGTTILFTPFLWMWTFQRYPGPLDDPPTVFWMTLVVFAICVSASIFRFGITYFLIQPGSTMVDEPKVARLVRRLPEDFCGKIVHLAIDGHIVRVITNVGTFDLRMRFSDAVDEVSEITGICAHRSHWVALAEIAETITVKGRPCLVLSNGDMVPVSRKYEPDLGVLGIL